MLRSVCRPFADREKITKSSAYNKQFIGLEGEWGGWRGGGGVGEVAIETLSQSIIALNILDLIQN